MPKCESPLIFKCSSFIPIFTSLLLFQGGLKSSHSYFLFSFYTETLWQKPGKAWQNILPNAMIFTIPFPSVWPLSFQKSSTSCVDHLLQKQHIQLITCFKFLLKVCSFREFFRIVKIWLPACLQWWCDFLRIVASPASSGGYTWQQILVRVTKLVILSQKIQLIEL